MDASALSDSVAIPDSRPTGSGWRGLTLRAEDWLLAGWVVLAAPLLAVAGGSAGPFDSGHPLTGLLLLTGFAGAIACLAMRSSGLAGCRFWAADSSRPRPADRQAGAVPIQSNRWSSGASGTVCSLPPVTVKTPATLFKTSSAGGHTSV
jgi:hypothetical protein